MVAYARRYPVLTYYLIAIGISWGAVLAVVGPTGFLSTTSTSELFVPAGFGSLLGPAIAGLLMTGVVSGRAGFGGLRDRLVRWRVGAQWYAIALTTAPLANAVVLIVLSRTSSDYLPAIVTSDDKVGVLVVGLSAGPFIALCEELGWTGFAMPRLLERHGVLATGLLMGVIWGIWHLPLFAGAAASAGSVGPIPMLTVMLFGWLVPYRILMVWAYDHTRSLPIVMLLHYVIVIGAYAWDLGSDAPPEARFMAIVAFGGALWLVVAGIALVSHGHLTRPSATDLRPAMS